MAQAVNESEHLFVEWAMGISPTHYDVERVASLLRGLGEEPLRGLDVGGGIGRYAQLVCDKVPDCRMTVLDKSELAIEAFVDDPRLQLHDGDYFDFAPTERYDFLIFKTVLHHFIGADETQTLALQRRALAKARELLRPGGVLLIEENFYQGVFGGDLPGRLIFAVTRQRWIATLIRRLGANTAGEGVRFRAFNRWRTLLNEAGFTLHSLDCSPTWGRHWPLWQRLPLLSSGRFQGVLEAQPLPAGETASAPLAAPALFTPLASTGARITAFWRSASSRVRWWLALAVLTGPAVSTCALSEA